MAWCNQDLFVCPLSFVLSSATLATSSLRLSPCYCKTVASLCLGLDLAEKNNCICPSEVLMFTLIDNSTRVGYVFNPRPVAVTSGYRTLTRLRSCVTSVGTHRLRIRGGVAAQIEIRGWYYQWMGGSCHKLQRGMFSRIFSRALLKSRWEHSQGAKSIQTDMWYWKVPH